MERQTEILLVGETAESSLQLTHWLEKRGCKCRFASSCQEACRLISGIKFDFVLSHFELPDRTAYPLLEKLIGSATTPFLFDKNRKRLLVAGCTREGEEVAQR